MRIIEFLKKHLIYRHNYDNESYIKYLRNSGIEIGENVKFFSPRTTIVDKQRPYLVKIGNGAKITANVVILAHDFSYSVLRPVFHELQDECRGMTIIGNNTFIGIGSIIMPGVRIGDNSIIGTGSVVTRDIPENVVAAGNPAKVICSIDLFYKKRKARQVQDAFLLADLIRERQHREPSIKDMRNFYFLFLERDLNKLKQENINTKISGDDEGEIINDFMNTTPVFKNFDDFLIQSKNHQK